MYLIGKTGTGKSTLFGDRDRAGRALRPGPGATHGDPAEGVLARIPAERRGDLIWFNVPDVSKPVGFNPL